MNIPPDYILRDLFRNEPDKLRKSFPEIYEQLLAEHEQNRPSVEELDELGEALNDKRGPRADVATFDLTPEEYAAKLERHRNWGH